MSTKRFQKCHKSISFIENKKKLKRTSRMRNKKNSLRSNDCLLFDPFSLTRHTKKFVRYFRGEAFFFGYVNKMTCLLSYLYMLLTNFFKKKHSRKSLADVFLSGAHLKLFLPRNFSAFSVRRSLLDSR